MSFFNILNYFIKLLILNIQMGNITVDKQTSSLDDWLDYSQQLQTIEFVQQPKNHISIWKIFYQKHHTNQIMCYPIQIDPYTTTNVFNTNEVYIVLAVKVHNIQQFKTSSSPLSKMLNTIFENIDQKSYTTEIFSTKFQNTQAKIYVFFGKEASNYLQVNGLSYALKLGKSLNHKNICILTNGCFIKGKKLQKKSTVPLCREHSNQEDILEKFKRIKLVQYFVGNQNKKLSIFRYVPKMAIPQSISEQSNNSQTNQSEASISVNNSNVSNQPSKSSQIKPPMLKLAIKPYQEVTYQQIADQQNNGIKFDIRATARHELKMEKFQKQCNQIIQGIFVSGQKVAKDYELLKQYNITQIINCAGDYCHNWHEDKEINYLTFFLKDSQNQNIECLFYRAIQFIQNAHKNKKNVLIHCIQGISRSITICIAYMIFTYGYDYKKAQSFVKQKRGIACPNNGFMVQLIQFHKRLYQDFNSLPIPRVFLVSSHSKETPQILTARMIKQPLFSQKKYIGLDVRGVYIIQTQQIVYLWVGSKCQENSLQKYWSFAQDYIKKLQKYQRAPIKVKAISQGAQDEQFFSLWNLQQAPEIFEHEQYNRLFVQGESAKPGGLRKYYEKQQQKSGPTNKLYTYPDYENGLGVFDLEDLSSFSVIVNAMDDKINLYLWRSPSNYELGQQQQSQFIDQILKNHYEQYGPQSIEIGQQYGPEYSSSFLACFS